MSSSINLIKKHEKLERERSPKRGSQTIDNDVLPNIQENEMYDNANKFKTISNTQYNENNGAG